ncbi:MAG TPA: glycerophosphodiester phosphodiesterase [Candidatus Moranbacteria bacterium]|jgi:glycerophosphoryl diester phosphodiesterase|nr:glycerophosphodiester phosphodiesterase [Candidatus Moranbacteria bacterium]HOF42276.1 glycerophosphodiester phosphodiesterase [Candidatus Moranbacteria bacterium]HPX94107.1 glycerophosphodiester phosphodiesterase [Candidatus Moranbacteria bacterium]HQB59342.1 glycerophosphodiester phosphodiesterase [Candidatus Moranbacteria bacterium]
MVIIAHRGASGYVRENTLEAFEKAIELGADMVEFDVRKTADEKLVLFHDPEIEGKDIARIKYQELLKISERQDFHVPTLEETLKFLQGRTKLDVEIKEEGYEREAIDLILKYFDKKDFIVVSFKEKVIECVKKNFPDVKAGLLLGHKAPKNFVRAIVLCLREIFPFFRIKKFGVDFVDVHWKLALIPFYMKVFKFMELPVIVWTLDDPKIAKYLAKHGHLIAITTNYPNRK